MSNNKEDMSKTCGFKYNEFWTAFNRRIISKDEWNKWYNENCGRCKYMCEICMYGEDVSNGDLYDVYYRDGNGERQCVRYFGYSKRDAEKLFNSEKYVDEEIIEIKNVND